MKTDLFILMYVLLLTLSTAFARIGETKQEIADRMFAKTQHAYVYNSKEDRLREALELPYKYKMLMFPDGAENFFLFKKDNNGTTAQGDTIAQHELYGWELHLVFYQGKSVMEFYRRHTDPMTIEEIEELMKTVASKSSNGKWQPVDFSPVVKQWNFEHKNKSISNKTFDENKTLRDILPQSSRRFVYVEVPEDVLKDGHFKTTLISDLLTIENRKANEKYRNYVAKQTKQKAAKTAKSKKVRQNAPAKINVFPTKLFKWTTQTFYNPTSGKMSMVEFLMPDIEFGNVAPIRYDKSIQITTSIPLQDGTAFGYTYETEDKTIRAIIYQHGILFIDSKFDKNLRLYMEELYLKQSQLRTHSAKQSISNF